METDSINYNDHVVELKVTQEKLRNANKKLLEIQDELRKSRIHNIEVDGLLKLSTEKKHDLIVELSIKKEQLLFMQEALNQMPCRLLCNALLH